MLILINIFNRSHTRYWSMLLIKKRKEKDIEVSWVIKKHGHDKTPSIPCLTCVGHRHVGETIACVSLVCWEVFFLKKKKKKNCGHGLNMVTQSSLSLSLCHSIDCLSVSPPRWVFRLVAIQACFQFKILGKKKMLLLCEAYVKNSCLWRWRMEFWERLMEYRLRNRILVLDNQFSN